MDEPCDFVSILAEGIAAPRDRINLCRSKQFGTTMGAILGWISAWLWLLEVGSATAAENPGEESQRLLLSLRIRAAAAAKLLHPSAGFTAEVAIACNEARICIQKPHILKNLCSEQIGLRLILKK